MQLLTRWVGTNKGWKPTELSKEIDYIKVFYPDIEEIKKRLANREIISCSIKLYRLYNGVV